jgi:hypothetical protein
MLSHACSLQTAQVRDKIVTAPVLEEERIRGHERGMAHLRWIVEVGFQPERRATRSYLRKIRTLAAIADQGRVFPANLIETLDGTPQKNVSSVWPDVLGVAVDAAFGNVDLAASFNLRNRGGRWTDCSDRSLDAESS